MPDHEPSRLRKLAKWGGVGLLAGVVLSLPILNLFLATPIGRGVVARKVSAAMRMPVAVGSASYSPWAGVQLKDVRIEQVDQARAIIPDPFFSAASFGATLRLTSLFGDEVVIDRLVCDSPSISLVRAEKPGGEGILPAARSAAEGAALPAGPPTSPSDVSQAPGAPAPDPATAPAPPTKLPASKARRKISLGELELRGGSVKVSSLEGEMLVRIDGLRMSFDFSEGGAPGTLRFDRAELPGGIEIENFLSPIQVAGRQMQLTGFDAECGGGNLAGEIELEYQSGALPFVAKVTAREIDAARLIGGGSALGLQSGKISSQLFLQGLAQAPKSLRGQGRLWVDSATIQPGAEFEKLRSALKVSQSGKVELEPARAAFAIRGGAIELQEASLGSGQVLVKSVGEIGTDGALNVAARLYLGAELYSAIRSKPVPGRLQLQFERLEGTDWFYRDELVTGTLKDPLLDFWRTGRPVPAAEVMGELSFEFSDPKGDSIGLRSP